VRITDSNKMWFMTVLLAVALAGCGSDNNNGGGNAGPVSLGTAGNYVIFANTGIGTDANPSVITGNIGVGPGVTSTAITGFALDLPAGSAFATSAQVTGGNVYAFDYAVPTPTNVNSASLDMGTAYTDAAGRTATSAATTNVGAGTLTGLTLTRGVYEWGSAITS
jgi:hypothetical protein